MFDLKTAKAQAREYATIHSEAWSVIETPANAQCNQHPFNIYNTGRYMPVRQADLADYLAGGCKLVAR